MTRAVGFCESIHMYTTWEYWPLTERLLTPLHSVQFCTIGQMPVQNSDDQLFPHFCKRASQFLKFSEAQIISNQFQLVYDAE